MTLSSFHALTAKRILGHKSLRLGYLVVHVTLLTSTVHAGSESYVCEVASRSVLTAEGTLKVDLADPIVGKQCSVDRESGKIIGRHISSSGHKTEVLEQGSESQSFKMLARSWGALHISIWRSKNSPMRP